MLDKAAIRERALKHHSENGRVVKALDKVFSTAFPAGANLIIEFLKFMYGLPYGHVDMCMDKVVDCAELWRITFYIWFGIDIGNYSDAVYYNKLGRLVATKEQFSILPTLKPLTLVFYHTSSKKKTGHVAGIEDSKHIIQSGASILKARVGETAITWGKGTYMCAKEYLTDEQYQSVIVDGSVTPVIEIPPTVKYLSNNSAAIGKLQTLLNAKGAKLSVDGVFGSKTLAAVKKYQKKFGLKVDGVVGPLTWGSLLK